MPSVTLPRSTAADTITYSSACRASIQLGSSCHVPKPAVSGGNWASGIDDEYFVYVPTQYNRGGLCKVGSTTHDTLIAAYAGCARHGAQASAEARTPSPLAPRTHLRHVAQAPLAFSNSEGHAAQISFPCAAGKRYYLFWNAEYMPGKHAFTIAESCASSSGAGCERAHRERKLGNKLVHSTRHRARARG